MGQLSYMPKDWTQEDVDYVLGYSRKRGIKNPGLDPRWGLVDLDRPVNRIKYCCAKCKWPLIWHVVADLRISGGAGNSYNHQIKGVPRRLKRISGKCR